MKSYVLVVLALAAGTVPALAQSPKPSRAEVEAKLAALFPGGHRVGQEGVMKLGGQFRTIALPSWERCRETCLENPATPTGGCILWTFIKANDAKLPSVCRMWREVPDLRDNAAAVSGAGQMK